MHSAETLANLQKFLALLNPTLNLNEMLANVARQLVEMFEVEHSGVLFFGEQDLEGKVIAEYPNQGAVALKVPLTDYPLMERIKVERKPMAVLDAQNDPAMGSARPTMRALGIQSIVIIPLVVQNKMVGSLSLDAIRAARTFTGAELELCHIIGNQIAVAVDYTRALEIAETSRRQAQTLSEVNRVLGESLDPDDILPLILEQLHKVISADGSSIHLLVPGGVQLVANRGSYDIFPVGQTIPLAELWGTRQIIKHKKTILLNHTNDHPHWQADPDSPIKSWLGLPLSVMGEVVGVLNIDGYQTNQFGEADVQLAQAFARQVAVAIHNARLYRQAEKRAEWLTSVQEIGLGIAVSLELKELLQTIGETVLTLLEAAQVRVYLYEMQADAFTLAAVLNGGELVKIREMQPRRDGLTARVARTGRYMAVPNIAEHPLYQGDNLIHSFKAIIGAPLKKGEQVLGVLNVFYSQPHYFTSDELDLLHILATQAAVALENARLYRLEQVRLQSEAQRAEQWQRVQEISSILNASLDLDQILNGACEQFVRLLDVDHCGIVLVNEDGLSGRVVAEYPARGAVNGLVPLTYPAFEQMCRDHQPYASYNVPEDTRLGTGRTTLTAIGVKSVLLAPLVAQGQVIGSIGLDAVRQVRLFTEEELHMCQVVTDQMAIAITNARTYQAERVARARADTLSEVAAILGESLELNKVLEQILAQLERVVTYDTSSIILRDRDIFRIVATRGFDDSAGVIGTTFIFADKPHFQEIDRTHRPLVILDTLDFSGWRQDGPTSIRSWIGAPLLVSDRLIGLLAVDHGQPHFYTREDGELVTAFAHLAAIALENARLYEFEVKQVEQELTIARQIQQGFLPDQIPCLPGWEIAAICLPARETGGDFYEFVERADDTLGLIVGDVSGKSIPAAMLMAAAQSFISAKGSDYRSPAAVMTETNRLLYKDVPAGAFVATSYALFSAGSPEVSLSNGGQLAPVLVPANGQPVSLVETPGSHLPLGILADVTYDELALALAPGDLLIFHTDGVVERKDEEGRLFGFERLIEVLEQLRGQPPETVLRSLLQAADAFANGIGPADDVTLVVVRRRDEFESNHP